jgi:hypothetical protein
MVTLKTYTNVFEAGFAHSLLEASGLHPFLLGEHSYTMEPFPALNGIRLQVPEAEVQQAMEALQNERPSPLPEDFDPSASSADEE